MFCANQAELRVLFSWGTASAAWLMNPKTKSSPETCIWWKHGKSTEESTGFQWLLVGATSHIKEINTERQGPPKINYKHSSFLLQPKVTFIEHSFYERRRPRHLVCQTAAAVMCLPPEVLSTSDPAWTPREIVLASPCVTNFHHFCKLQREFTSSRKRPRSDKPQW